MTVLAFNIPAAFLIEGTDENDAARRLVDILSDHNLTQDHRAREGETDLGPIEQWDLPNHPLAMGADNCESVLIFHPTNDNRCVFSDTAQDIADYAIKWWYDATAALNDRVSTVADEPLTSENVTRAFQRGYEKRPLDLNSAALQVAYDQGRALRRKVDDNEI